MDLWKQFYGNKFLMCPHIEEILYFTNIYYYYYIIIIIILILIIIILMLNL